MITDMDQRLLTDDQRDLAGRTTMSVEEAGLLLGIGRSAAYEAVRRGEIPALRIGRRIVVPVPRLLQLLGVESTLSADSVVSRF